jgi:UBX domain-containing protein 1
MIHSLADLNKKEDKSKKTNNFYAGGQASGLAVSSPDADQIINKASKEAPGSKPEKNEVTIKLTLYSNGFTVNDGPFRNYTDPQNQAFMSQINQNRVPQELLAMTQGKPVAVQLQDKRQEEYKAPPPPSYVAFSGHGMAVERTASQPLGTVNMNAPDPPVETQLPTTNVQIRFHNGQRKNIIVNLGSPVMILHEYVNFAAPVSGSFQLVSGFPPKPLENMWESIEEAGIAGSAVIQKLN